MAIARTVAIKANLVWDAALAPSANRWIGECVPLNIAVEADSLDELHSLIPETLDLLFGDLLADNELDAFLLEHGWTAAGLPSPQDAEGTEFDIPWTLVAAGSRGPQREAN